MIKLKQLLLFSTLVVSHSSHSIECVRYQQGSGVCPLGVTHIRHLQEHDSCQNGSTSRTEVAQQNCQEQQTSRASDHWLYTHFGLMGVAAMSPDEIQSAIESTLNELKGDMVDEIARIDFEENFKNSRKINTQELSRRWFQLKALSARGGTDLENFNNFNRSEEVLAVRRILRITNPSQFIPSNYNHASHTIYRPYWIESQSYIDGTDVNRIDIANLDWDNVPASGFINGRPAEIKNRFTSTASIVYDKIESQLRGARSAADFNRAFDSLNEVIIAPDGRRISLTPEQIRRIRTTFTVAGQYSQTQRTGVSMSRIRPQANSPHSSSRNRLRLFGAAAGAFSLASAGAAILGIVIENQAQCESAYPYTPIHYRQPAITGNLPVSMRCEIDESQIGHSYPSKTRRFLNLSPDQMVTELNANPSDRNSICSYFIRDFNSRFNCASAEPTSPASTPSEPTNVSQ